MEGGAGGGVDGGFCYGRMAGGGGGGVEGGAGGGEECVEVLDYAVVDGAAGEAEEVCVGEGALERGRGGEGRGGEEEVPRRARWLKQNWGVRVGFVGGLDMVRGLGAEGAFGASGDAQKRPATLRYDADESVFLEGIRNGASTESIRARAGLREYDL